MPAWKDDVSDDARWVFFAGQALNGLLASADTKEWSRHKVVAEAKLYATLMLDDNVKLDENGEVQRPGV